MPYSEYLGKYLGFNLSANSNISFYIIWMQSLLGLGVLRICRVHLSVCRWHNNRLKHSRAYTITEWNDGGYVIKYLTLGINKGDLHIQNSTIISCEHILNKDTILNIC